MVALQLFKFNPMIGGLGFFASRVFNLYFKPLGKGKLG
jgi:hypothetical protein